VRDVVKRVGSRLFDHVERKLMITGLRIVNVWKRQLLLTEVIIRTRGLHVLSGHKNAGIESGGY